MTIRVRITAWYAAVLAAALLAAAAITYAVVRQQLQRSMDASMASIARSITAGLEDEASENRGALPLRSANELLAQFRDNDSGIILLNGLVKVHKSAILGDEVVFAIAGAGDLFGEMSAIRDATRSASVTALTGVQGVVLPAPQLRSFFSAHPNEDRQISAHESNAGVVA